MACAASFAAAASWNGSAETAQCAPSAELAGSPHCTAEPPADAEDPSEESSETSPEISDEVAPIQSSSSWLGSGDRIRLATSDEARAAFTSRLPRPSRTHSSI
jgi:hypothetical protein